MLLGGRYEMIEVLGTGGFGITYKATDTQKPSKPICVVKELLPQHHFNTRIANFFEKEARILEMLGTHPQIPHLLAYFEENQKFYIVQEFIQGRCLDKEILRGKPLSEGYVTKLLQDVLEVLAFVHQQGVIHRDIKPPNLIRRQQDGKVCLIDFGIVKEMASQIVNSRGNPQSSIVAGTYGYMPSEQARGKTVFQSDIYAVGITAIQALTGLSPQSLEENPETGELEWKQEIQLSDNLAEVLTKMVRRHYSLRYANAQTALDDLKKFTSSVPSAIPAPPVIVNPPRNIYFQEVASRAQQSQGDFSVVALKVLELKRIELGLSELEAREIRAEVLQPYRESQLHQQKLHQEQERKLKKYEQIFTAAVNQEYPFSAEMIKYLQEYRQYLGLKNEYISVIEKKVLALKEAEYERQRQEAKKFPQNQQLVSKTEENYKTEDRNRQEPLANKLSDNARSSSNFKTSLFEFETAKLILKPGFFGLGIKWEIQRLRKTAALFLEELENGIILELVAIPGGNFFMGSPENELESTDRGSPQHPVTIKPFFMGKFTVTQAQWKAVSSLPKVKIDLNPDPSHFKGANRPAEQISWYEAQEFCARLSRKTGKLYRLPSEAEWEYACRAGTNTPFYFGTTISTNLANYNGEYVYNNGAKGVNRKETTNVGTFPANAFGLHDMHGNVWEWCEDGWYDNYIGAPIDGSARLSGSDNHPRRLLRGGSWSYRPVYCRSAYRVSYVATCKDFNHGFRVACSAPSS
ncbi:bifunctional serine/threonine-protein kinase/formylglycine-generating enzyme family protein [Anabaena lutea]|uniref:SUMF1/EgtB/PvdO family nonheme iron enzyme n=1 Tax=Anabaena lutea FACHB-196 TaxID=2692881 RepID=A0ABR8FJ68_9NOST|nr:bifunctional serine/threonine-protein kinase/formylglycine-generating enzyme family protein [Anabaena lutea]MBD2569910.1 SUMF1/EgtB/PvdO family nonheme iron enzyme [Anabaena lutea FACHB-196]